MKTKSILGLTVGSIALAVCGFFALPKIMEKLSTQFYRVTPSEKHDEEDDWGPVIELREKKEEDKQDGNQR